MGGPEFPRGVSHAITEREQGKGTYLQKNRQPDSMDRF